MRVFGRQERLAEVIGNLSEHISGGPADDDGTLGDQPTSPPAHQRATARHTRNLMPGIASLRIRPTLLQRSVRRRPTDEPYLRAYPLLLTALRDRVVTPTVFVEAAHMAYGWMPTALSLSPRNAVEPFVAEAALAERVRGGGALLTAGQLEYLALSLTVKRGSMIGLSKVLHFTYHDELASLIALPDFRPFHDRENRDLGHAVNARRAVEVVMFSNVPKSS